RRRRYPGARPGLPVWPHATSGAGHHPGFDGPTHWNRRGLDVLAARIRGPSHRRTDLRWLPDWELAGSALFHHGLERQSAKNLRRILARSFPEADLRKSSLVTA